MNNDAGYLNVMISGPIYLFSLIKLFYLANQGALSPVPMENLRKNKK